MRLAILILVTLLLALVTVPVLAAGEGLSAGDTVRWSGKAPGLGVIGENDQLMARYGEPPACDRLTCSLHEVEVGERGELIVTAADGAGGIEVDVFSPGGAFVAAVGLDGAPTTVRIPQARAGTYLVQVTTSQSIDRGGAFTASATLR